MSDAGLGSLGELRGRLITDALDDAGNYDTALLALGKGVARSFDSFCCRDFARLAGDVKTFDAYRLIYVLPRYPVEAITKIETKDEYSAAWAEVTAADTIRSLDLTSGLLEFWARGASQAAQMRVTYTGGYWFDTTDDLSGTITVGATALPDDLKLAWLLQCEHLWHLRDKLGASITEKPGANAQLAKTEMIPAVVETLRGYMRYQLS